VLRLTHTEREAQPIPTNASFWVAAIAISTSSAVLAWRSRKRAPEYSFSLVITAGLLLYPATLAHYALMLVVPLLLLWRDGRGRAYDIAVTAFATSIVCVTGVAHGAYAFWAVAGVWCVFAVLAALQPFARRVAVSPRLVALSR
jgi:hypothetical protein